MQLEFNKAIDFLKKNHKDSLIKFNDEYIDKEGNNYDYYKNLYNNPFNQLLKPNEKILKITKKFIYDIGLSKKLNLNDINYVYVVCPFIDDKRYDYKEIDFLYDFNYISYNNIHLIINYPCNTIEKIYALKKIFFNITLPKLKVLHCQEAIFNTIQPIEELYFNNFYYSTYKNFINNFDNILIKLPNLKKININNVYEYNLINNNWILSSNYRYQPSYNLQFNISSINKDNNLIANVNTNKLNFDNINTLTINYYSNYYRFRYLLGQIHKINIFNVKNVIINVGHNIFIKNIKDVNEIRINKSIINSILCFIIIKKNNNRKISKYEVLNYKISTIFLNCFEINNDQINKKDSYFEIIKQIINNLIKSKNLNQLNNVLELFNYIKDIPKDFYNNCKKLMNRKKYNDNELNIIFEEYKYCINKNLNNTLTNLQEILKIFNFKEDNNYFIFTKK